MTVLADEQRMRADEQRFDPGALVELFEIDARAVGGHRHRFVPGPWNGAPVTFGGTVYTPTPGQVFERASSPNMLCQFLSARFAR